MDSETGPGEIRLYWTTSTDADCFDSMVSECPPPGPPIDKVALQESTQGRDTGWHNRLVRSAGGRDSTRIAGLEDGRPHWFRVVAFDVAGRQLVKSTPIMTVPGPRSAPVAAFDVHMTGRFSWSPRGDSIAYAQSFSFYDGGSLRILDLHSMSDSELRAFTGEAWISDAMWDPGGGGIAFTHSPSRTNYKSDYRIWTHSFETAQDSAQSPGRVDFDADWGADGWLYFCRGSETGPNISEIWRVRPGTPSSAVALTADRSVRKFSLSVRSSDQYVALEGWPVGDHVAQAIYTMAPANGALLRLLPDGDGYLETAPRWSPDGYHVVFCSTRSGHPEVWEVDVRDGALRQLTRRPRGTRTILASWSPDGSSLAVVTGMLTGNGVIGQLEIHPASTIP
jgi:hypothetical protein